MKPMGVGSKWVLASTSRGQVLRRAKAGRSRARAKAKREITKVLRTAE